MNLATVLLQAAERMPHAPALHGAAGVTTFGALRDRVARVAAGLRSLGTGPGERVAIAGANDEVFVVAYLATLWAGAVAVPVNPLGSVDELRRELEDVEPAMLVVGAAAAEAVSAARAAGALLPAVVAGGTGLDVGVAPTADWNGIAAADPLSDPHERADDDLAVLLFTAGTAGAPKAAMLTHGNLAANIAQIQAQPALRLEPHDIGLALLPFFHVFGLNVVLGVPLAAGASAVLVAGFDPPGSVDLIRQHSVTVVAAVPPVFSAWLRLDPAEAPPDAFASVRLAVSGAAALPREVVVGMRERFGLVVHDGFGLTEASPAVTTTAGHGDPRPGSIGPPLPGIEIRLVDVDGHDVLEGDPGEVWVRGPNVFPGYWRDPETTARVLTDDGWLRTGDVAVADPDGSLSLVDRLKDLIIVNGFNVYPIEVEDVLREHQGVGDVAVVGRPSPRTGEQIVAYVVPAPGRPPDPDDLARHCAARLTRYKRPASIEIVDELPRSLIGKVLRRVLRDEAATNPA